MVLQGNSQIKYIHYNTLWFLSPLRRLKYVNNMSSFFPAKPEVIPNNRCRCSYHTSSSLQPIGATSNDIIAPPMCQVSEIYSRWSDLINSAKVEVGSLALVDFCRIFGSSWFQSFNVFGIKLSLKVSVRACGI